MQGPDRESWLDWILDPESLGGGPQLPTSQLPYRSQQIPLLGFLWFELGFCHLQPKKLPPDTPHHEQTLGGFEQTYGKNF